MKPNVGSTERIIRIIVGLALLSLWFVLSGNLRYLSLIGLVPLLTAAVRWCPLWAMFRIDTNK